MVARSVAFWSGPNSRRRLRVIWPLALVSLRTTTLSSLGFGGKVPRSYFCSNAKISARRAFQSSAFFTVRPSTNRSGSGSPLIFGSASKSGGSSPVRCEPRVERRNRRAESERSLSRYALRSSGVIPREGRTIASNEEQGEQCEESP